MRSHLYLYVLILNLATGLNPSKILKKFPSLNQINYRRCVSCKKIAPKASLWRVVRLASSHKIQLDRGMGRSAYLCPNLHCLTRAKSKNCFRGALKTKVPDNIYQNLQERLS